MNKKPGVLAALAWGLFLAGTTVSAQPPAVVSLSPGSNELGVSRATSVRVYFDTDMDPTTFNYGTFLVSGSATGRRGGAFDAQDDYAVFDPTDNFRAGEVVTVILTIGIESSQGTPLESSYSWSFTVAVSAGSGKFVFDSDYAAGSHPRAVVAADFNDDGYLDLAVADSTADNVIIFPGLGDGTFDACTTYPVGDGPTAMAAADVDGINGSDLITANANEAFVTVLYNDGDGNFSSTTSVACGASPISVCAADLDGDGWVDIATADFSNNIIWTLPNLGAGTFGTPESVNIGPSGGFAPVAITAADVDEDGHTDIITANYWSNNLSLLANDGSGGFSSCATPNAGTHPQAVFAADIDADADLDLISADVGSNCLSILRNEGGCSFAAASSLDVGTEPNAVAAADLNGDDDLDLVPINGGDDSFWVLANDSYGGFDPGWVYATGQNPGSVCVGDFDGDGKLDLAVANSSSADVSVFLNRIFPRVESTWPSQHQLEVAASADPWVEFTVELDPASVAGDPPAITVSGSISGPHEADDVIYSEVEKRVTFYPTADFFPGEVVTVSAMSVIRSHNQIPLDSAFSWSFTVASDRADTCQQMDQYEVGPGPWEILAADFNNDGSVDLVTCNRYSNSLTLRANDGSGTFVTGYSYAVGEYPGSVTAADLDGDGWLDLATVNTNSNDISVLLNHGDGTFTFDDQLVFSVGSDRKPVSITAADLNGDGHIDLATADRDYDEVSIVIGHGDGSLSLGQRVGVGDGPESVSAGDLDNDGDIDLAVANKRSNDVSVLLNDGSATLALSPEAIEVGGVGPFDIDLADIDSDGWLDIITADSGSNDVAVLLNSGDGGFDPIGPFPVVNEPQSVVAADINGDGLIDVVAANESWDIDSYYYLSVLLNDGAGGFAPQIKYQLGYEYEIGSRPYSVTAADLDNDGDLDLATTLLNWNSFEQDDIIFVLFNRSFTYVTASEPGVNEPGVDTLATIAVEFNDNMEAASINGSTVFVWGHFSGLYQCGFGYEEGEQTATLTPSAAFAPGENVSVSVTEGVYSSEGFPLDSVTAWSFVAAVADTGGSFEEVAQRYSSGSHPWSVVVAELDGEAGLDLAIANEDSDDIALFFNDGTGAFTAGPVYVVGDGPRCVVAGDVNGDQFSDLATTNFDGNSVSVLLSNQDGTFADPETFSIEAGSSPHPASLVAADLDCDGDLDLATANEGDASISFILNDGSGSFTGAAQSDHSVGSMPRSIVAADLDNDGDFDLAVANAVTDNVSIRWNNGKAVFPEIDNYPVGSDYSPRSMVAGDFDGDGDIDLVTANEDSDNVSTLLNGGNRSFAVSGSRSVGESPFSICAGDFDGDLDLDVATVDFFGSSVSFLLNKGSGLFSSRYVEELDVSWPSAVCAGDLDGDADLDLVAVSTSSGEAVILLNAHDIRSACCIGRVGDANNSGSNEPTIGDITAMIDAKFITGTCDGVIECIPEADINQSGGVSPTCDDVTIGDITHLIDYLFITGKESWNEGYGLGNLAPCM